MKSWCGKVFKSSIFWDEKLNFYEWLILINCLLWRIMRTIPIRMRSDNLFYFEENNETMKRWKQLVKLIAWDNSNYFFTSELSNFQNTSLNMYINSEWLRFNSSLQLFGSVYTYSRIYKRWSLRHRQRHQRAAPCSRATHFDQDGVTYLVRQPPICAVLRHQKHQNT